MSLASNQLAIDRSQDVHRSVEIICNNCYFWRKSGIQSGYCNRFPPTWIGDRHEFAITLSTVWCGEFRPSGPAFTEKFKEMQANPPDHYPWNVKS